MNSLSPSYTASKSSNNLCYCKISFIVLVLACLHLIYRRKESGCWIRRNNVSRADGVMSKAAPWIQNLKMKEEKFEFGSTKNSINCRLSPLTFSFNCDSSILVIQFLSPQNWWINGSFHFCNKVYELVEVFQIQWGNQFKSQSSDVGIKFI